METKFKINDKVVIKGSGGLECECVDIIPLGITHQGVPAYNYKVHNIEKGFMSVPESALEKVV